MFLFQHLKFTVFLCCIWQKIKSQCFRRDICVVLDCECQIIHHFLTFHRPNDYSEKNQKINLQLKSTLQPWRLPSVDCKQQADMISSHVGESLRT